MLDEDQLDLVVEAASGLDADGQPLPGYEQSHRQLADALKAFNSLLKSEKATKGEGSGSRAKKRLSSGTSDGEWSGQKKARTASSAKGSPASRGRRNSGSRRASGSTPRGESPDKPFTCETCHKSFSRKWNLSTHQIIHDNDRETLPCPYPGCKRAIQGFTRKNDLQRHITAVHDGEEEPMEARVAGAENIEDGGDAQISKLARLGLARKGKHRCACGRSFVRRDAMKRHRCEKKVSNANPIGSSVRYGSFPPSDDDEEDDFEVDDREDEEDDEIDEVEDDEEEDEEDEAAEDKTEEGSSEERN